ncbi:uncharacterized protein LOC128883926 isoform X2 [Hylaeus volcanicus]|nr:uncharacterized protein LOC128883926 isoform X2 [Hylaeus volcanicus]
MVHVLKERNVQTFISYEKFLPNILYHTAFRGVSDIQKRQVFQAARRRILDQTSAGKCARAAQAFQNFRLFFEKCLAENLLPVDVFSVQVHDRLANSPEFNHPDLNSTERDVFVKESLQNYVVERRRAEEEKETSFIKKVTNVLQDLSQTRSLSDISIFEIKNSLRQDKDYYDFGGTTRRHEKIVQILKDQCNSSFSSSLLVRNTGIKKAKKEITACPDFLMKCRSQMEKEQTKKLFYSLLVERIKNPFLLKDFKEATDVYLSYDERLKTIDSILTKEEEEQVYDAFKKTLRKERLEMLRKDLKKNTQINTPNLSFEKVFDLLHWGSDKRYRGLCIKDFQICFIEWKQDLLNECIESFEKYLKTSTELTSRIDETGEEFLQLMDRLSTDQRYTRLDNFAQLREELVKKRLNEIKNEASRLYA